MDTKKELIKLATEKYGSIKPCSAKLESANIWTESSFTDDAGYLIFWFNDQNESTHIVTELML